MNPMNPQEMAAPGMQEDPQAMQEDPQADAVDQETFEQMVAGLLEFIHGKGRRGVMKKIEEAKDEESLAEAIGMSAYTLTHEAASQMSQKGASMDMDMLLGVATEMIDALVRMAQAMKKPIADPETLSEQALIFALNAYIQTANPSEDEKAEAMAVLQQMGASGMLEEGAAQLQDLGARSGVDPFAQSAPQQKPMAKGIQQGLMGMPA